MKGFPVLESQYIQRNIESVEVLIVPSEDFQASVLSDMEAELRKRLGSEIVIDIKTVEEIPRGAGGKLRAVISHL